MGTETWIISLPLSDSILYLKIIHPPNFREEPDLISQFKDIYGQDIYLENDSQDYQMTAAFALKTYDTMQLLQIVYNNQSPKSAVGSGLDSLVKLNGIKRKSASYSTCVVTLTGTPGTVIAAGVVQDDANHNWILPTKLNLVTDTLSVTAQCQDIGAIEAPIGSINKIYTPQKGWTAVTNAVPAVVGDPIETDAELKARQTISVAIPSQNMIDSTIAGIASITGVQRYKVYDNDSNITDADGIPGHSIAAVVEGGLDEEVARQIYLRKGPGGGTYGDVIFDLVNSDGLINKIRFFRPTYIPIDITIVVKKGAQYTSEINSTIKSNLSAYLSTLDIGYNVTFTSVLISAMAAVQTIGKPEFEYISLSIGRDGNTGINDISIAFNEVADIGVITVEEVD